MLIDKSKFNQWLWWWAIMMLLLVAGSGVYVCAEHLAHRESLAMRAEGDAQGRLTTQAMISSPQSVAPTTSAPPPDFTTTGAAFLTPAMVFKTLTQAATANGVIVVDMQTQDHPATVSELARADLNLHLRGSYLATKALIREVQERHPWITVQRWSLQRLPAPSSEVESALVLNLWGRPLLVP
jgi:hypothetical protein